MRTPASAFLLILLATLPLHAAVVEHDFLAPGDGLLTYDDVNQREWLDLSYAYTSLDNIKSKMVPGEFLEDFLFATKDDVRALHLSAGPTVYSPDGIDPLIDKLGFIFRAQGGFINVLESTYGLVAVKFTDGEPIFDGTAASFENVGGAYPPGEFNNPLIISQGGRRISVTSPDERDANNWQLSSGYSFLHNSLTLDTGPFWLYRNAVPEPTSIFLLTIATLAALSTRNRRR